MTPARLPSDRRISGSRYQLHLGSRYPYHTVNQITPQKTGSNNEAISTGVMDFPRIQQLALSASFASKQKLLASTFATTHGIGGCPRSLAPGDRGMNHRIRQRTWSILASPGNRCPSLSPSSGHRVEYRPNAGGEAESPSAPVLQFRTAFSTAHLLTHHLN